MGSDVSSRAAGSSSPVGTSFRYSFPFLPADRRRALGTVYAFCRATDDIVDDPGGAGEKRARLGRWSGELSAAFAGGSSEGLLHEIAGVARSYSIPPGLFHDLVRGVGMDLSVARYDSFDGLREYCHLVASTVGLMCIDIFGRRNPRTEAYAMNLGIALQLTNIIRDVGADALMGRIYIPIDDLKAAGCTEEEILSRHDSDRFRRLLELQASRAEGFYGAARSALSGEDAPAMRPARIMEAIYRGTLEKIRDSGFDVLRRNIRLSKPAQLGIAVRYGLLGRLVGR